MAQETASWQTELWSYLTTSDGKICPTHSKCQSRYRAGLCPISDGERVLQRLAEGMGFDHNEIGFVRPVGECRILQLVEMLAEDFVKRGAIGGPPVPRELVSLAAARQPIEIRAVPLNVYQGGVWNTQGKWVIHVDENDTDVGRRFTIFHEAFHILACCRGIPGFRRKGGEDPLFHEMLCDHFAGCVLMPAEWVKEEWPKVNDLKQMSRTFGVSDAAMFLRLRFMGLV